MGNLGGVIQTLGRSVVPSRVIQPTAQALARPTDARVFPRCERLHTLALDEKKSTSISRFIKTNLGEVSVAGQGVE
jgi:hypothetical protein